MVMAGFLVRQMRAGQVGVGVVGMSALEMTLLCIAQFNEHAAEIQMQACGVPRAAFQRHLHRAVLRLQQRVGPQGRAPRCCSMPSGARAVP